MMEISYSCFVQERNMINPETCGKSGYATTPLLNLTSLPFEIHVLYYSINEAMAYTTVACVRNK